MVYLVGFRRSLPDKATSGMFDPLVKDNSQPSSDHFEHWKVMCSIHCNGTYVDWWPTNSPQDNSPQGKYQQGKSPHKFPHSADSPQFPQYFSLLATRTYIITAYTSMRLYVLWGIGREPCRLWLPNVSVRCAINRPLYLRSAFMSRSSHNIEFFFIAMATSKRKLMTNVQTCTRINSWIRMSLGRLELAPTNR